MLWWCIYSITSLVAENFWNILLFKIIGILSFSWYLFQLWNSSPVLIYYSGERMQAILNRCNFVCRSYVATPYLFLPDLQQLFVLFHRKRKKFLGHTASSEDGNCKSGGGFLWFLRFVPQKLQLPVFFFKLYGFIPISFFSTIYHSLTRISRLFARPHKLEKTKLKFIRQAIQSDLGGWILLDWYNLPESISSSSAQGCDESSGRNFPTEKRPSAASSRTRLDSLKKKLFPNTVFSRQKSSLSSNTLEASPPSNSLDSGKKVNFFNVSQSSVCEAQSSSSACEYHHQKENCDSIENQHSAFNASISSSQELKTGNPASEITLHTVEAKSPVKLSRSSSNDLNGENPTFSSNFSRKGEHLPSSKKRVDFSSSTNFDATRGFSSLAAMMQDKSQSTSQLSNSSSSIISENPTFSSFFMPQKLGKVAASSLIKREIPLKNKEEVETFVEREDKEEEVSSSSSSLGSRKKDLSKTYDTLGKEEYFSSSNLIPAFSSGNLDIQCKQAIFPSSSMFPPSYPSKASNSDLNAHNSTAKKAVSLPLAMDSAPSNLHEDGTAAASEAHGRNELKAVINWAEYPIPSSSTIAEVASSTSEEELLCFSSFSHVTQEQKTEENIEFCEDLWGLVAKVQPEEMKPSNVEGIYSLCSTVSSATISYEAGKFPEAASSLASLSFSEEKKANSLKHEGNSNDFTDSLRAKGMDEGKTTTGKPVLPASDVCFTAEKTFLHDPPNSLNANPAFIQASCSSPEALFHQKEGISASPAGLPALLTSKPVRPATYKPGVTFLPMPDTSKSFDLSEQLPASSSILQAQALYSSSATFNGSSLSDALLPRRENLEKSQIASSTEVSNISGRLQPLGILIILPSLEATDWDGLYEVEKLIRDAGMLGFVCVVLHLCVNGAVGHEIGEAILNAKKSICELKRSANNSSRTNEKPPSAGKNMGNLWSDGVFSAIPNSNEGRASESFWEPFEEDLIAGDESRNKSLEIIVGKGDSAATQLRGCVSSGNTASGGEDSGSPTLGLPPEDNVSSSRLRVSSEFEVGKEFIMERNCNFPNLEHQDLNAVQFIGDPVDDFHTAVLQIHKQFPSLRKAAVGFSTGANVLIKSLAKEPMKNSSFSSDEMAAKSLMNLEPFLIFTPSPRKDTYDFYKERGRARSGNARDVAFLPKKGGIQEKPPNSMIRKDEDDKKTSFDKISGLFKENIGKISGEETALPEGVEKPVRFQVEEFKPVWSFRNSNNTVDQASVCTPPEQEDLVNKLLHKSSSVNPMVEYNEAEDALSHFPLDFSDKKLTQNGEKVGFFPAKQPLNEKNKTVESDGSFSKVSVKNPVSLSKAMNSLLFDRKGSGERSLLKQSSNELRRLRRKGEHSQAVAAEPSKSLKEQISGHTRGWSFFWQKKRSSQTPEVSSNHTGVFNNSREDFEVESESHETFKDSDPGRTQRSCEGDTHTLHARNHMHTPFDTSRPPAEVFDSSAVLTKEERSISGALDKQSSSSAAFASSNSSANTPPSPLRAYTTREPSYYPQAASSTSSFTAAKSAYFSCEALSPLSTTSNQTMANNQFPSATAANFDAAPHAITEFDSNSSVIMQTDVQGTFLNLQRENASASGLTALGEDSSSSNPGVEISNYFSSKPLCTNDMIAVTSSSPPLNQKGTVLNPRKKESSFFSSPFSSFTLPRISASILPEKAPTLPASSGSKSNPPNASEDISAVNLKPSGNSSYSSTASSSLPLPANHDARTMAGSMPERPATTALPSLPFFLASPSKLTWGGAPEQSLDKRNRQYRSSKLAKDTNSKSAAAVKAAIPAWKKQEEDISTPASLRDIIQVAVSISNPIDLQSMRETINSRKCGFYDYVLLSRLKNSTLAWMRQFKLQYEECYLRGENVRSTAGLHAYSQRKTSEKLGESHSGNVDIIPPPASVLKAKSQQSLHQNVGLDLSQKVATDLLLRTISSNQIEAANLKWSVSESLGNKYKSSDEVVAASQLSSLQGNTLHETEASAAIHKNQRLGWKNCDSGDKLNTIHVAKQEPTLKEKTSKKDRDLPCSSEEADAFNYTYPQDRVCSAAPATENSRSLEEAESYSVEKSDFDEFLPNESSNSFKVSASSENFYKDKTTGLRTVYGRLPADHAAMILTKQKAKIQADSVRLRTSAGFLMISSHFLDVSDDNIYEHMLYSMVCSILESKSLEDCSSLFDFDCIVATMRLYLMNTIKQDNGITKYVFGRFLNVFDYLEQTSCKLDLEKVDIPTLMLHSKDDPLCEFDTANLLQAFRNPNLTFAITHRGGHACFLSGFRPKPWYLKVILEFVCSGIDFPTSS